MHKNIYQEAKKLYLENGYVNMKELLLNPYTYIFGVGARGIGKTYGGLKALTEICDHTLSKFIYLRRTNSQVDLIYKPEFNPFKKINDDCNWDIIPDKLTKYSGGFFHSKENEDGEIVPDGQPIGFILALSTFYNLRSVDLSDVDYLFYDEFIPQRNERSLKGEGEAFLHLIETISRNRELNGQKPLKVICMANPNTIDNEIFLILNLITAAEKLQKSKSEILIDTERSMQLILFDKSPISKKKSETTLYKLTRGTDFYNLAIQNEFEGEEKDTIKQVPLIEYRPIVNVGEISIYKHKSRKEFFCCRFRNNNAKTFLTGDLSLKRFKHEYDFLYANYMFNQNFIFETYLCQILLERYFN